MISLLIGGDVCPINKNRQLFEHGDEKILFNDLIQDFEKVDYSLINLECPLIEHASPIEKDGFCFGVPVASINVLKALGIDAFNLANNHILDHGEKGLRSTILTCIDANIDYFGAGANLHEANTILVREIEGLLIGMLGIAEHEFSIAGNEKWGANPIDVIEIVRALKSTQHDYDFLLVLVHGGREYYPYPSPRLQQLCRFLVELGAGAVVCQHSHCVGSYEYYQNAPIIYGQGNFIADSVNIKSKSWYEGILIHLKIKKNKHCLAEWIPIYQSLDRPGVRRMVGKEAYDLLQGFESRSEQIKNNEFVNQKWGEYCQIQRYLYASRLRGHNRLLRGLNSKLHYSDWVYSKTTTLNQRNVVECETHREVLETLWRSKEKDF
ncbi:MAG: CapA family protein [Candidatus Thiodiazotropha sp.]|jgi:poly-gamma-glutamate synthesis protein (capsule biosynthesis protein)